MSRVASKAIEDVKNSKFIFGFDEQKRVMNMEVQNAVIIWPNFSGLENKFGNSARTFNLVINEEAAEALSTCGWKVRTKSYTNPDDEKDVSVLYFINIKVNMDASFPPVITLFTEFKHKKSRIALNKDTIKQLDTIEVKSADCIINGYESNRFPGKITGYLKKLNVIQEEECEFGGKYDDWLSETDDEEEQASTDGGNI